ncbi:MAG: hypothetical protein ACJ76I_15515 [Gaiellaceae bacterium]
MKRLVFLTILASLVAASAAVAALTPSQYRATLNGVCRGYTPKINAQERAMTAAKKANDGHAYGAAFGKLLVLTLAEDSKLESIPVPLSLRATMTPIFAALKKADMHIRVAIFDAGTGDTKGMAAQLTAAASVAKGLNAKLDAAGLRDCGSHQT